MTARELYKHLSSIDDSGRFCVSFPVSFLSIIGQWLPSEIRESIAEAATAQHKKGNDNGSQVQSD